MKELEMALIGTTCIANNEKLEYIYDNIDKQFFEYEPLGKLFEESKKQWLTDKKINALALANMSSKQVMINCSKLADKYFNAELLVTMLIDDYKKRRLKTYIDNINGQLIIGADYSVMIDTLNECFNEQQVLQQKQNDTSITFVDACVRFYQSLSSKNNSFKTGISNFDNIFGGIFKNEVTVLSSRSGGGKTDFAIYLATKCACQGKRVLYCSMEMDDTELIERIASNIANIEANKFRDKTLTDEDYVKLSKSIDKLSKIPLIIDKQKQISIEDIQTKIQKHKPDIIFIDHIGLMKGNSYKKQWENVFENSQALKRIALETHIPIIELVQQNSNVEKRGDKSGMLSDLKGSDGLGNDADNVLFLRSDYTGEIIQGDAFLNTYIKVSKNRHGISNIDLCYQWQPQYHKYKVVDNIHNA